MFSISKREGRTGLSLNKIIKFMKINSHILYNQHAVALKFNKFKVGHNVDVSVCACVCSRYSLQLHKVHLP